MTSFLDRLELLLKQATPGKWTWFPDDAEDADGWCRFGGKGSLRESGYAGSEDAALIVALVNAAPGLVAALRAANQATDVVIGNVGHIARGCRSSLSHNPAVHEQAIATAIYDLSAALAVLSGADTNEEAKT